MLKDKFEKIFGPIDDTKKPDKKVKKPKQVKAAPVEKEEEQKVHAI